MMKQIKVNKGEWSEFYTLLKLLSEQKLYAADEDLNKLEEIYFPLLKVITAKNSNKSIVYELNDGNITIITNDGQLSVISSDSIKSQINKIFNAIKEAKAPSFEIPLAEEILNTLKNPVIKGFSTKKSDIDVILHDFNTGIDKGIGFSIKSRLGNPSTLLNAGEPTNFIFEVVNYNQPIENINTIKTHAKVKDRIKAILEAGGELRFIRLQSSIFNANLSKVDSLLPILLAEMLCIYYSGNAKTLIEINEELENKKFTFVQGLTYSPGFNSYKIKQLLMNIALGMTPARLWDGQLEAHGGYIIVREDGEIVCYHIYNLDSFKDYLFKNTKFETASTTKYKFGEIYEEGGRKYISLNLQIRFIK